MASTSSLRVSGLAKGKLAALRTQAESLGLSAEGYARQLIEQGILMELRARTTTFDEMYAPAQARFRKGGMAEEDLDKLVDAARSRHHRRTSNKTA